VRFLHRLPSEITATQSELYAAMQAMVVERELTSGDDRF
jgi:hypothetical protein